MANTYPLPTVGGPTCRRAPTISSSLILVMGGNLGITGARKVAEYADAYGRLIIPHVLMSGAAFLCLAPSLHDGQRRQLPDERIPFMIHRCLPSPPRRAFTEPLHIDADGYIPLLDKPGLGLELDEDRRLHAATVVVTV